MKLQIVFVYLAFIFAVFFGNADAGSKRWRKFEKKAKNAFKDAKEALPTIQGYVGVATAVAALGKK